MTTQKIPLLFISSYMLYYIVNIRAYIMPYTYIANHAIKHVAYAIPYITEY